MASVPARALTRGRFSAVRICSPSKRLRMSGQAGRCPGRPCARGRAEPGAAAERGGGRLSEELPPALSPRGPASGTAGAGAGLRRGDGGAALTSGCNAKTGAVAARLSTHTQVNVRSQAGTENDGAGPLEAPGGDTGQGRRELPGASGGGRSSHGYRDSGMAERSGGGGRRGPGHADPHGPRRRRRRSRQGLGRRVT